MLFCYPLLALLLQPCSTKIVAPDAKVTGKSKTSSILLPIDNKSRTVVSP